MAAKPTKKPATKKPFPGAAVPFGSKGASTPGKGGKKPC